MTRVNDPDFYRVLGVPENITPEQLKRTFRQLARENHPDKNPGNAAAEERFKKVSEAYDILSDPKKRAEYDRERKFRGSNGATVTDDDFIDFTPPPPRTRATSSGTGRKPGTAGSSRSTSSGYTSGTTGSTTTSSTSSAGATTTPPPRAASSATTGNFGASASRGPSASYTPPPPPPPAAPPPPPAQPYASPSGYRRKHPVRWLVALTAGLLIFMVSITVGMLVKKFENARTNQNNNPGVTNSIPVAQAPPSAKPAFSSTAGHSGSFNWQTSRVGTDSSGNDDPATLTVGPSKVSGLLLAVPYSIHNPVDSPNDPIDEASFVSGAADLIVTYKHVDYVVMFVRSHGTRVGPNFTGTMYFPYFLPGKYSLSYSVEWGGDELIAPIGTSALKIRAIGGDGNEFTVISAVRKSAGTVVASVVESRNPVDSVTLNDQYTSIYGDIKITHLLKRASVNASYEFANVTFSGLTSGFLRVDNCFMNI